MKEQDTILRTVVKETFESLCSCPCFDSSHFSAFSEPSQKHQLVNLMAQFQHSLVQLCEGW